MASPTFLGRVPSRLPSAQPGARRRVRRLRAQDLGWLLFLVLTTLPFVVRMLAQ